MVSFLPFMLGPLLQINTEQLTRIAVFVVILFVVWMVMRIILRFTIRLFTFGCGAILVFGLVLILMRLFSQ